MSEVKTTTTVSTDSAVSAAAPKVDKKKAPGLTFNRFFTTAGVSPYDERRVGTAHRSDHRRQGRRHLRAEGRRGPRRTGRRPPPTSSPASISTASWAARARDRRARSSSRAWSTPSATGACTGGYFRTADDAENFRDELAHLMLHQKAASTRRSGSTSVRSNRAQLRRAELALE